MTGPIGSTARPALGWASLSVLAVVFVLDRGHKLIQVDLFGWQGGEVITVTPFFDYVLVWNTGVSYGLLAWVPPPVLIAVMALAVAALFAWWLRTGSAMTRWGLALALGGALGNLTDRFVYGAVADFFSVHALGYYFYIFNIADVGISAGLLLLVIDMFKPRARRS